MRDHILSFKHRADIRLGVLILKFSELNPVTYFFQQGDTMKSPLTALPTKHSFQRPTFTWKLEATSKGDRMRDGGLSNVPSGGSVFRVMILGSFLLIRAS